jgi:hypothetical protein
MVNVETVKSELFNKKIKNGEDLQNFIMDII